MVIFALWHIRVVTVPLFFAMVFATLLLPLTDKLTALGLPIAGTLIAITFFCGFIPILGAFISGLIVFLIALAGGGVDSALIMLAVLLVVHGAESIWIAPMTYRKTVALNPIATLAAVTAGAALMGIVGAIIAVPIVAFFWVVLNELRTEWAAEDGAAAASG